MQLSEEEEAIEHKAFTFARSNRQAIANKYTSREVYLPEKDPVSVFMAGSPGAGKTEASKVLIASTDGNDQHILRIDADELRCEFDDYIGANSYLFQKAVSILVERIHDNALKRQQSFILDGTLSNLNKAISNIERSIRKGRFVQIIYVYQHPLQAWKFVQAREIVEGRKILAQTFIEQHFSAWEVVNELKVYFGKKISIDLLLKNIDGSNRVYKANIDRIDNHIGDQYNADLLAKELNLL